MHPSGSMYLYAIEMTRAYVNEVAADAKFDNLYLSRFFLHQACADVLQRVVMSDQVMPIVRHRFTVVAGQEHYPLPPHMGQIVRVAIIDANGIIQQEAMPRGQFNPSGPGWSIEGSTLVARPFPIGTDAQDCDVWFIPNANVSPHYADGGGTNGYANAYGTMGSSTTFTLAATPIIGDLDLRAACYSGYVLRVLSSADHTLIEERLVASYDNTTRIATVRSAFSQVVAVTNPLKKLVYEIVPIWSLAAWDTIALNAAMRIAVARNLSGEKKAALKEMYATSLKTLRDGFSNAQGRTGKSFDRLTVDNSDLAEANWPLAYGVPGRVVG